MSNLKLQRNLHTQCKRTQHVSYQLHPWKITFSFWVWLLISGNTRSSGRLGGWFAINRRGWRRYNSWRFGIQRFIFIFWMRSFRETYPHLEWAYEAAPKRDPNTWLNLLPITSATSWDLLDGNHGMSKNMSAPDHMTSLAIIKFSHICNIWCCTC